LKWDERVLLASVVANSPVLQINAIQEFFEGVQAGGETGLHGATLQVHRPAHLHGWSIHFTSTKSKKPRFLKASTIPSNDPAMMVMLLLP